MPDQQHTRELEAVRCTRTNYCAIVQNVAHRVLGQFTCAKKNAAGRIIYVSCRVEGETRYGSPLSKRLFALLTCEALIRAFVHRLTSNIGQSHPETPSQYPLIQWTPCVAEEGFCVEEHLP